MHFHPVACIEVIPTSFPASLPPSSLFHLLFFFLPSSSLPHSLSFPPSLPSPSWTILSFTLVSHNFRITALSVAIRCMSHNLLQQNQMELAHPCSCNELYPVTIVCLHLAALAAWLWNIVDLWVMLTGVHWLLSALSWPVVKWSGPAYTLWLSSEISWANWIPPNHFTLSTTTV